jgi:hypothetical protein
MGKTCSTHGVEEVSIYKFGGEARKKQTCMGG